MTRRKKLLYICRKNGLLIYFCYLPFHGPQIASLQFAVGGLLIGLSKSNSPGVQNASESGWIMPLRQEISGKMNLKMNKRRLVKIQ